MPFTTLNTLKSLGFIVNYKKSVLTPINNMKFLGFNPNTMDMLILLPQEDQVEGPDDT